MDSHVANVWVHVAVGVAALAVGLIPLLSQKGASLHRLGGNAFVWLGAVVLGTALIGIVFFDPPVPLIAASVAAGYQYLSSLRALQLKGRGPGLIDAALAAAGLAACAALYFYIGSGTASWTPAIGYSTIGYVALAALYDLSRHAWSQAWQTHVRPLDHGLKMTGAYFAMMSAGVGNIFRDMQPWSQIGPTAIGLVVILLLAASYFSGRRRAFVT